MENPGNKVKWRNILIWILFIVSITMIIVVFIKYSLNKNYSMVDRIPCINNTADCFVSEYEEDGPYKVIILKEPADLNCTEKDESCEIEKICENVSENKCKIIGCKDDLASLPKGYDVSGVCFE